MRTLGQLAGRFPVVSGVTKAKTSKSMTVFVKKEQIGSRTQEDFHGSEYS